MKLIIEIDEDIYNDVKTKNCFSGYDVCKVKDAIKNGTPLCAELSNFMEELSRRLNNE